MIAKDSSRAHDRKVAEEQMVNTLVFKLAGESYGIPVSQVREVLKLETMRSVPRTLPCIEGLMNVRNRMIAVIDLRKRFGLAPAEITGSRRILIVRIPKALVGLIVDSVEDVFKISGKSIQELPSVLENPVARHFFFGLAQLDARVVLLLNLVSIFSSDEMEKIAKAQNEIEGEL